MLIEILLIVGILIASLVWHFQARRRRRAQQALRHSLSLEVLAARYAQGEIDRTEYLQKRSDILGSQLAANRA